MVFKRIPLVPFAFGFSQRFIVVVVVVVVVGTPVC